MSVDPTVPSQRAAEQAPAVPAGPAPGVSAEPAAADPWAHSPIDPLTRDPGDEPTLPVAAPAIPPATPAVPSPAPTPAKPDKWEGRVIVVGASAPGQKKAATPPAPTRTIARYAEPGATAIAGYPAVDPPMMVVAAPRRRRSGARRFFGALLALVLILAVPVVSAYVSYKLTAGENPFTWPPTMDLSHVF